jgi:hypothetical protein
MPRLPNGSVFLLSSFGRSFLALYSSRGSRARARRLLAADLARYPDAVIRRGAGWLAVDERLDGCCAILIQTPHRRESLRLR